MVRPARSHRTTRRRLEEGDADHGDLGHGGRRPHVAGPLRRASARVGGRRSAVGRAAAPRPGSARASSRSCKRTASNCRRQPGSAHEASNLGALALVALVVPTTAGAAGSVEIRRVDFSGFPVVRVTAVAPGGGRPAIREDGRPVASLQARQLGSAAALMLAVDNSASMRGAPLREAKRAASDFLAQQNGTRDIGLVAFGHEALALTLSHAPKSDVARTLGSLAPTCSAGQRSTTRSSCRRLAWVG